MNAPQSQTLEAAQPRQMAVIDIGSTSIRMTIAQLDKNGIITPLESLQQPLTLGKDTFTKGYIRKVSIEDCVKALKKFRRTLDEYQITGEERVRVVATTAVREAANREAFIDRIYVANGMNVEVIDEVDVERLTYLSVHAHLGFPGFPASKNLLVTEMSGGSTELLVMQDKNVIMSKNYRLGSLRLREMLEAFRAPLPRQRQLMENDIERTVSQIRQSLASAENMTMLAIGGDMRFAASMLVPDWNHVDPVKIQLQPLARFTEETMDQSVDQLVHKHHISFSDAETLGPSLVFYLKLAKSLDLKHIVASNISMRHGVLVEMALRGAWSEDFMQQIVRSAIDTGRKFRFDEAHALHVAGLCETLFDALKDEHRLDEWYKHLLKFAALLHDIGSYVSVRSHHKHSMYLIQNSELFGLSRKDIGLIALIARYHRRSAPKPVHVEYMSLDHEGRLLVSKLAAILRVADALDRSNSQRFRDILCSRDGDHFVITVSKVDDLALEELGIQNKGTMFEEIYGMNIVLRKKASAGE